jgi:hypothetical protein
MSSNKRGRGYIQKGKEAKAAVTTDGVDSNRVPAPKTKLNSKGNASK